MNGNSLRAQQDCYMDSWILFEDLTDTMVSKHTAAILAIQQKHDIVLSTTAVLVYFCVCLSSK